VCADDAHGTAIMLRAEREGITPEQLIERIQKEHEQDFAGFLVKFDNYYSTHSEENREFSTYIYERLRDSGHIATRTITTRPTTRKGHVPRGPFHQGHLPEVQSPDQYGDNCEACGATYTPMELIEPQSVHSGATPEERDSEHYFFTLPDMADFLHEWTRSARCNPQMANKLAEWALRRACRTGTSAGMPPTSDSRFLTRPANTSMYGSMRPSVTSQASGTCATSATTWTLTITGRRIPTPRFTTSSARTSSTSTRFSGPPC